MTSRWLTISALIIVILFMATLPVQGNDDWYIGFNSGQCVPTDSFDEFVDDDITYGLSVDYVPGNHLGVRVAYDHNEFNYDFRASYPEPLEIDTLGVWAIMDYNLPKYFRFYALIGPTYFYSKQDHGMNWGDDDSKDIGWSTGAGFEFFPIPGWGFRFQSIYNSAELGDGTPRACWVSSTIGMSFKF